MNANDARSFVNALEGLIRQEINSARDKNKKFALDDFAYDQDLVDLLIKEN